MGAVDEVLGEGFEGGGGFAEGFEGGEGVGDELGGVVLGLLDAEDGGPGGFVGGGVLAGGLAELVGGLGHVEDVVDDLEGEAGLFAEGAEAGDGVGVATDRGPAVQWPRPSRPPQTMEVVMRAPVLARWMRSTSSAVGFWPSPSMSMTWPPIMPGGRAAGQVERPTPVPMAKANSRRISTMVAGGAGSWAMVWKARVWRASPARMAMASPKTTWQVGWPRRRSSLSSAGRSSWMSE